MTTFGVSAAFSREAQPSAAARTMIWAQRRFTGADPRTGGVGKPVRVIVAPRERGTTWRDRAAGQYVSTTSRNAAYSGSIRLPRLLYSCRNPPLGIRVESP